MPRCLNRRALLRAGGVCIALPLLDAMQPAFAAEQPAAIPRRMICIETNMGILPQFFFPEKAGRDYELSPYLQKLAAIRNEFTVFSGVSHPFVTGGHAAEKCFLTGTPHPVRPPALDTGAEAGPLGSPGPPERARCCIESGSHSLV
jgi:hypothetical protein